MTRGSASSVIARLTERFVSATALAAAVGEVESAMEYPAYLAGIVTEVSAEVTEVEAVFVWAVRRGEVWE